MQQGSVVDQAGSYAGLRASPSTGKAVKLNGQAVFQRLVLDQGLLSRRHPDRAE